MASFLVSVVLFLIRLYQICISPWLRASCRFQPTCSHYATEVVCSHGLSRGLILSIRRILQCAPWGR